MRDNSALYRSSLGYAAMMKTYAAQLARWPVPVRERTVATRHGDTHLLASGPPDALPLVLIHGLAASALVWRPNVAALSARFRVYALDNIGDAGQSAPTRPSLHGPAYAEWLVDVLDALEIERANVVGISLGGWLALKLAIHAPDRVAALIPVCPAGFVAPRLSFVPVALCASLFPTAPTIDLMARTLCALSAHLTREDSELLALSLRYHRTKWVPLATLPDADLARISAPTRLLVGEHEAIYSAAAMVARARRAIPGATASIVPGAGHALNSDQPGRLHDHIFAVTESESVATS